MDVAEAPLNSIATAELRPDYLQQLDRQNVRATGAVGLLVVVGLLGLLFSPGGTGTGVIVSNAVATLASVMGASWAWITAYRARRGGLRLGERYQLAWLLIGLGLLFNGLGRAFCTFLGALGQPRPIPSIADLGFTFFYPLTFAGLVLMLTGPRPTRACVRMGLDAAITTFCLLGISWYAVIAPAFQHAGHVGTATLVTVLSYPFWDFLLIMATLMIMRRCAERILHPSLLLCSAGLIVASWADASSAYFTALHTFHTGVFSTGPFWCASALLIGLSARYQYAALAHGAVRVQASSQRRATGPQNVLAKPLSRRFVLLQSTLLYLPLCILVALTLVSELFHDEVRTFFLVLLTALVGLLLTTRYLLATYENELLLRERERRRQETEQLYQQLQSAYQRLQELDQLKDQFMMTASHELRTPLTSLQGYLELLAEHADRFPPERRWDFLQKAQQSCDEVVLLLRNVIDATRLEMEAGLQPVHLERVVIQDIVQSVMTLIGPQVAQEQREVHIHVPSQLAVQADPERLRQVLLNLSVNALKYSPPGTPLTFSAQAIADKVRISVTDKGRGIPPEDQARLFQRFVRLDRDINSPIRGSGLGLYISRRLIEAMGGNIWIESTGKEGEGTTFHIVCFNPASGVGNHVLTRRSP